MKGKQSRLVVYCLTIGLIAALTMVVTACSSKSTSTPTPTATAAVTQYQNTAYKYSINILPGWTVDSSSGISISINSPELTTYVRITCTSNSGSNLDAYVAHCMKILKEVSPDYAEQSRTQVTASGGLPAYLINLTYTKDGAALRSMMLITINGNYGYCLVGAATPAEWGEYSSDLASIINSLTVVR